MNRPIVCLAALLAACASPSRTPYEDALAQWRGAQEIDLVRAWGTPASRHEAGGRRYVVFDKRQRLHLPAAASGHGDSGQTGVNPTMDVFLHCITTFELDDARVTGWSYRGNHCASPPAAPAAR